MSSWADMQRAGITKATDRLRARVDRLELLGWFGTWLETIDALDEQDCAAVAVHPATGFLADALEAADLQDEAVYLRAFTIVTGPIRPGVWFVAQLLGRASAHRFITGLVAQKKNTPHLFGLEYYGAFDAFQEEAADILRRDAVAKAAAATETARKVAEARENPGNFAVFTPEQAGIREAIQDYQDKPTIKEAWETRLESHVRFGSTLLRILLKADATEFLRQAGALPHPVFAEQVLPDASHLSEDDLLYLLRDAPIAFDDAGVYRAAGMTVIRLLHRVCEKIRMAAWGVHGPVSIPPEDQDQLDRLRAETEHVITQHLDILFMRTDATYLAWAWLARLIYEGEHRGYWRPDRRRGEGIVLDPLIMLILALAKRLEPRPDFEGWVRDVPPLWRIERVMAGIAVHAFALQPEQDALERLLEWTLVKLTPAFPGAADAVLRPNGVIGRIGAYGLLGLNRPGDQLMRLWQIVRPLREQAWRTNASDDDHHDVAQVLILWGLDAIAAASPETQQPLWSACDEVLRDALQIDRAAFHGEFWSNVLQRYGWIVAQLLPDTQEQVTQLVRTVRCHVRPDQPFVQFVLAFVRAGGDRSLLETAVAEVGTELSLTLKQFLQGEQLRFERGHFGKIWIDEVNSLYEAMIRAI